MEILGNSDVSEGSINYEGAPIAEVTVGETEYRLDPDGGSTVAISSRESGSYRWALLGTGKWDGLRLKAKGLDHAVVTELAAALKARMSDRGEPSWG